ncbi:hypothetical protein JX266_000613 [Neoarthrinium moseri]|nr:hypothetical protein JX266_000613 [Neoarthrinium moseri]
MPPNSFAEWIVGSNTVRRKKAYPAQRSRVALEWTTDDETGDDTVHVTLPAHKAPKRNGKHVRFEKQAAQEVSNIGTSEETSEDEPDSDCPCGKCVSIRRRLKKRTQAGKKAEQAEDTEVSESGGDDTDEAIDSDCPCRKCVGGRKRLSRRKQTDKKTVESTEPESDAEIHAKHMEKKAKQKQSQEQAKSKNKDGGNSKKNKNKGKNQSEDESETAVESEDTTQDKGKQSSKSNQSKKKGKGGSKQQPETSEDESAPEAAETTEEEDLKAKTKKKSKQQNNSAKGGQKDSSKKAETSNEDAGDESTSKKKKKDKSKRTPINPQPPRRPELLMPTSAQVLQVEHSVETVADPRPNAFFDAEHGIMRVYHGQAYGNPTGVLYPKRLAQAHGPLGILHPSQNPYFYGFAPPHGGAPAAHSSAPPPVVQGAHPNNPWFQGYGTVTVPGPQPATPKNPRDAYNASPSLRAQAKKDNNVGPFAPRSAASGGSKKTKPDTTGPWDIQGAQGSKGKEKENAPENNSGADDVNKPWSPQKSAELHEHLQQLGSKKGSKAGSQKSDNGWGTTGNGAGWGLDDNANNGPGNTRGGSNSNNNNTNDVWGHGGGNNAQNNGNWDNNTGQNGNSGGNLWGSNGTQNNTGGGGWGASSNKAGSNNQDWGGNPNTNDKVDWGGNANGNSNPGRPNSNKGSKKGSPTQRPPSTAGNVGGWDARPAPDDNRSQLSHRSHGSNNSRRRANTNDVHPPSAWPQSDNNVFGTGGSGSGSGGPQASSPSQRPPSTAGNVAGNGDDWGEAVPAGGGGGAGNDMWGGAGGAGPSAPVDMANETGGFWDTKQGQADEHMVQNPASIQW